MADCKSTGGTYPGLDVGGEAINKLKHSLCLIDISTLSVPFRETHNVLSDTAFLSPFSQGLPCFKGVVRWLEITKQRSLKVTPAQHITLHLIPSVSLPLH